MKKPEVHKPKIWRIQSKEAGKVDTGEASGFYPLISKTGLLFFGLLLKFGMYFDRFCSSANIKYIDK